MKLVNPRRMADGLALVALALRFVATTAPGAAMGATIALCAVASYVDLGVSYEARAFVGAALAVAASVLSELAFGAISRVQDAGRAHWGRALLRGAGGVGGALFASGGLDALRLAPPAHAVMLIAIVWIAVGPVLADAISAYRASGDAAQGAIALRAVLGTAAAAGLGVYGIAAALGGMWWIVALPWGLVAAVACAPLLADERAAVLA